MPHSLVLLRVLLILGSATAQAAHALDFPSPGVMINDAGPLPKRTGHKGPLGVPATG